MVANPDQTGETLQQIADRHGRAYNTLKAQWSRHPAWPDHIGKEGRFYTYDPAAVDAVIAEYFSRPPVTLESRRLYTAREIEELTGIKAVTIRADVSRGRWPAPDDISGRAHRWAGATVKEALKGRRAYGQS
ncbi:hypothetical protein [Streptomyces sp. NPDC050738]|uniref:helix-turn-helix transcriptional regulator n=1 Tax=Streptomyces sp. NPDC050738 TaxID=3154744 RepID=UPI00343123AE